MPANDVEVNATFTVNKYLISYYVDGETYFTDSIAYGEKITPIDEPTRVGETFSGWNGVPESMPARDVIINGTFGSNSYTITYYVDGEIYQTDICSYGSEIKQIDAPIKEGYTFSGWSEIPATMPANDVEVTGTFSINSYILTYKVDGAAYKIDTLKYATTITPLAAPTKEGYTFSGWSEIPATMPANDVEVTGSFDVNKYLLQVLIDGIEVYSDSIEYGTKLIDYVNLITSQGIDLSQWEWYSQIETISMPAHDVIINAVRDAIQPIMMDSDKKAIFDLTGKKIDVDDISILPSGIYIRNGRKIIIK